MKINYVNGLWKYDTDKVLKIGHRVKIKSRYDRFSIQRPVGGDYRFVFTEEMKQYYGGKQATIVRVQNTSEGVVYNIEFSSIKDRQNYSWCLEMFEASSIIPLTVKHKNGVYYG